MESWCNYLDVTVKVVVSFVPVFPFENVVNVVKAFFTEIFFMCAVVPKSAAVVQPQT